MSEDSSVSTAQTTTEQAPPAVAPPAHANGSRPEAGRALFLIGLLIALIGFGVAADLTHIHVKVHTDPSYRSFCAMTEKVNCDAVAESPYSVFLGVPVSVWGMFGYLVFAGLMLAGMRRRYLGWPTGLLWGMSVVFCCVSVLLGAISVLAITSVCILCMTTYLLNFCLLVLASVMARRRGGIVLSVREDLGALFGALVPTAAVAGLLATLAGGLIAFYPNYWNAPVEAGPGGVPTGITAEGLHWIGAAKPTVTVVEYSDYECPHCRRGHREMRDIAGRHSGRLRFIHRQFPLDEKCNRLLKRPFHPRACALARLAVCAARQGKAWEANDLLFYERSPREVPRVEDFAKKLEIDPEQLHACMADPTSLEEIKAEIEAGIALKIRGTPTYLLDGTTYPGHIPEAVLREALKLGPDEAL